MKEIAIDEARELVGNAALWPRVRDFLWDFAPSIHESWIGGLEVWKFGCLDVEKSGSLEGDASKPLNLETSKLQNLQTSPRVKRYLLSSLGVEPCFHDFPKEDGSRLALLDGETLVEIAKWLGALACAEELRKVTDGATVRALKAALPGVYPEVFGYTAYFRSLDVWKFGSLEDRKLAESVVTKIGCEMLAYVLSSSPGPLFVRFKLKLPKGMLESESSISKPPNLQASKLPSFQTTVLKLLKLKFPEAYALCYS